MPLAEEADRARGVLFPASAHAPLLPPPPLLLPEPRPLLLPFPLQARSPLPPA